MNVWDHITESGPIVLGVLILLIIMSIMTWAIIGFKWLQLRRAQEQTDEFLDFFWEAKNFESAADMARGLPQSPVAQLFLDGFRDLRTIRKSRDDSVGEDTALRDLRTGSKGLQRTLESCATQQNLHMESYLIFLATTAAAAPFIGLFGTVWGIMGAFADIGTTGSASLIVVAGPIAEALVATAAGLGAAIPAVAFYNYLLGKVRRLQAEMNNFGLELLNLSERYFLK
jgi:biopolymer transport protein TolQ